MKYLFVLVLALAFTSCMPIRYVDVYSHHNYYEKHRFNTYTAPILIPGRGVILQTFTVPMPRPIRRGRH